MIAINGVMLLRPTIDDLMDQMPNGPTIDRILNSARTVDGVLDLEKLRVRKFVTEYFVDLHVQADETLSLREAHILSGTVKGAIRAAVPDVTGVLIHRESYLGPRA